MADNKPLIVSGVDGEIDEAATEILVQLMGNTALPALLFVNTDLTVTRVDVDEISDPRTLEMLRAMMNVASNIQFKTKRWQDAHRP